MRERLKTLLLAGLAAGAIGFGHPNALIAQTSAGARGIQALEAARGDAYRNLLESVLGLRLKGEASVRDMTLASSEVRTSVEGFVRGASIESEDWEEDGSATVVIRIDVGRLEALLGRSLDLSVSSIEARGRGAPASERSDASPSGRVTRPGTSVGATTSMDLSTQRPEPEAVVPEFSTVITVMGRAAVVQKDGQTATQAQLGAERAAVADAYRQLLEYTYGVRLSSETTVRDMSLADDAIKTRVDAFVRGAQLVETKTVGDVSEALVSLDLSGLEGIVR